MWKIAGIILLLLTKSCIPVMAQDVAHCVCGEAEGELFIGQVSVAQAINNRGSLKGVYGCYSNRKTTPSCVQAVYVAKTAPDYVNGADHWLSDDDLRHTPEWVRRCRRTVKIGRHTFYRCGKEGK